jgi:hypothetical protein
MKITKLLLFALVLVPFENLFAQVWVNNTPGAFVKRVEIHAPSSGILPANPLFPVEGTVDLTFQNDVQYVGLTLRPTSGSQFPSFLQLVDPRYTSFTVYFCRGTGAVNISETCDGIAFRVDNGQLCAGYFQYNTLLNEVVTIADIGCFTLVEIIAVPQINRKDVLQRFTKEQLLDIIMGRKPINPIGPVCTSCPPWETYEKDLTVKLKELKAKKYKIEVKEAR